MRAQRKLISFIGIGAESAAPLFYSYLRLHPTVCAMDNDTRFFSDTKVYAQGIDWYEKQLGKCLPTMVHGELSFSYLRSVSALNLIAKTYPSAKLLAVIENPLVSVRVAYVEARRSNTISNRVSLAQFLKQSPEVLMSARYGKQLSEYFSFYAPTDLFVVTASDVREDTLSVMARAYDHIGVDKKFIPAALQHLIPPDEGEIKRKPGIIKRTYRFIKRIIRGIFSALYRMIFPPDIPIETASVVARQLPLSPELEAYLKEYYRRDVAMLSNLLHRDLSVAWGFAEDHSE